MNTSTISRIVRGCAAVVAFAAAVLTYRATTWVAITSHATSSRLAWLVPIVVDAGTVIAALLAYLRISAGERARAEVAVAVLLLALSVVTQVMDAHMHGADLWGQVLSAVPPLVLVAVAELLMREMRRARAAADAHAREAQAAADAEARRAERAATKAMRPTTASQPGAAPARDGDQTTREERLERLLAQHGQLSGPLVARELSVSEGHARKLIQRHMDSRAA